MHIIKRWQAYGFNCLIGKICFAQTEWYNGYVVIPKDHPLYGRHREDPDLNLQGDMFLVSTRALIMVKPGMSPVLRLCGARLTK